ncbi:hypothetical protein [Sedimentitalea sp.]|uniref:hypothetical protein n=1 Tax=Sedimentitalea sp. TaxID=2048915 RepID=UPI003299009C
MVGLNRDINYLPPEEIAILLNVSEDVLGPLLDRRSQRPLWSGDDLLEVVEVDPARLQELDEMGLLDFGNPLVTQAPQPLPLPEEITPPIARPSIPAHPAPLTEVLSGLSQLFSGLSTMSAMEARDEPAGKRRGGLPPLAEGQHRSLSDAKVSLHELRSGWMHRPPTTPGDAPGPYGHHTYWVEVIPPCYCLYVWILKGRQVGGREVGASALAAGATGMGISLRPAPASVDKVVEDIHHANTIFAPSGFQFCLCGVRVLDPTEMNSSQGDPNLADTLFTNTGVIYSKDDTDPKKIRPFQWLFDGFQYDATLDFKRRCVHIFYASDVQRSPQKPDDQNGKVLGVGGPLETHRRDKRMTPVGIVEGGGDSIAHEIGHGLGLLHPDRDISKEPLRPGEPRHDPNNATDRNNLLLKAPTGEDLNSYQAEFLKLSISANGLSLGCPGS